MVLKTVAGLLAMSFGVATSRFSSSLKEEIYENDNGHFIAVYTSRGADWEDAMVYCEDIIGTTLASVHTLSEHDHALDAIESLERAPQSHNMYYAWIGANDFMHQGTFEWTDGTEFDYANWDPNTNEPSQEDDEHCVHVTGPDSQARTRWKDQNCATQLKAFVCNRPVPKVDEKNGQKKL